MNDTKVNNTPLFTFSWTKFISWMFHDIDNYGFNVSMTSPSIQFQILNHGIYDKKYGEMSRFRFWSDKWGAMNNADKQRLSDDADERFQRNVNQVNVLP